MPRMGIVTGPSILAAGISIGIFGESISRVRISPSNRILVSSFRKQLLPAFSGRLYQEIKIAQTEYTLLRIETAEQRKEIP
jgi:hypothetical protein